MDDMQIVALLWGRSQEALTVFAEKYEPLLLQLARNILGSEEDAREYVNDTYHALWNSIPPQKPEPLRAYACRICKNNAISRLRKSKAAKRGELTVSLEELSECIGEDTLQQLADSKALGEAIDRFLGTLSKENRVLFLRRHWFGDSVSQIAKDRAMSETAVSIRLSRTRSKLKNYLIKEGFYEP